MAGGGNFVHRVLSYVVNELVVNGLANRGIKPRFFDVNPAFQRFAVRTSKQIEDISVKAVRTKQEIAEQLKDMTKNMESFKQ